MSVASATAAPARSGTWIPPAELIAAQAAHGASWALLVALALMTDDPASGLPALGWLHLVALGWLTLTALAVLVHVIPAFTDAVWPTPRWLRVGLAIFIVGVAGLVGAFVSRAPQALAWFGTAAGAGLVGYLVPAARALAGAYRSGERSEAAIARALLTTLAFLLATAALGVAFTWVLAGRVPSRSGVLTVGPPIHAALGIIGWLTMLVMGVSTRTVGPIAGLRSRSPRRHILGAVAVTLGIVVLVVGFAVRDATAIVAWIGAALLALGITTYAVDLGDVLRRATVAHRPPQAFLAAAGIWLVVALALGLGALAGAAWGAAYVFVALMGWVGQMVNGHLHHIGVRLLITRIRGDDDETRPGAVLSHPIGWTSFAFSQIAVAAGTAGLLTHSPELLATAGLSGLAGWGTVLVNVVLAARRAARLAAI